MRSFMKPIFIGGFGLAAVVTLHYAQEAPPLAKPLTKYTVGDLFPPVDLQIEQTAEVWNRAGADLHATATARRDSIEQGLKVVRQRIDELEAQLRAAKKSKNFTAEGTARGAIETEEAVLRILKELDKLSIRQRDVATEWGRTAEALRRFVAADDVFEPYRSRGVAKPLPGGEDLRLDPAGVSALLKHTDAMDDVGKSFEQLGSKIRSLAKERERIVNHLKNGGHLMTPPLR